MLKKRIAPLPKPTKKLYQCFDLSFYHEGRTKKKPRPVEIPFSELFLDSEEGCLVRIRSNLQFDKIARVMHEDLNDFPTCDGAMNYARIWNRRATYLCDESGGGSPNDHKTWVWYVIDNSIADNKIVRKVNSDTYHKQLTFSEADKVIFSKKYEFDGYFSDLLDALRKEGFQIVDS